MKLFITILCCIALSESKSFSELTSKVLTDRLSHKFAGGQHFQRISSSLKFEDLQNEDNKPSKEPTRENFVNIIAPASANYNTTLNALNKALEGTLNNTNIDYYEDLHYAKEDLKLLTEEGLEISAAVEQQVSNIERVSKNKRLIEANIILGFLEELKNKYTLTADKYNEYLLTTALPLHEGTNFCNELPSIAQRIARLLKHSRKLATLCHSDALTSLDRIRIHSNKNISDFYRKLYDLLSERENCTGCSEELQSAFNELNKLTSQLSEINQNAAYQELSDETSECFRDVWDITQMKQQRLSDQIKSCSSQ